MFFPHLINNLEVDFFPQFSENNDSPFIFVSLGLDPFSYKVFLEGMMNRKVLLSSFASSSGHFP